VGNTTPKGEYSVLAKVPVIDYKGANYDYPGTKWNLRFKLQAKGNLYIHGAYWHHNFGHPMSHGCVNVSYADMEPLYGWADVGTQVTIQ
jgi:lipoprotein-anchoring transpeptidase ErfK/SrfK